MDRVLMHSILLAAEGSTGSTVDIGGSLLPILNFGLLGVMFALIVSKSFIVTKYYAEEGFKQRDEEIARLRKEADEWKTQVDDLQKLAREQMVPAIVETNRLSAEYIRVLSDRAPTSMRAPNPRRQDGGGSPDDAGEWRGR